MKYNIELDLDQIHLVVRSIYAFCNYASLEWDEIDKLSDIVTLLKAEIKEDSNAGED